MCKEYVNIQTKEKLNKEIIYKLKDNALLLHYPHIFEEWDFKKNDELGLDIYEMTRMSGRRVWWICKKCNYHYNLRIDNKVSNNYCESCNSLALLNPKIAKEWHPTLNGDLTPHDVTCGSGLKVWWKCEIGHHYEATVDNRTINNRGCPYCTNRKVWRGYNDLWTTHPHIAEILWDTEDGYRYSYGAKVKLNWRCPNCQTLNKNKLASTVIDAGLGCLKCKDNISYGEKFIYSILKMNDISFYYHPTFQWSNGKQYDFYIPEFNVIVEVHGKQHYLNPEGSWKDNTNLEEIQENDRYKEQLAYKNGIQDYIIIDARLSSENWLRKSVLEAKISSYVNYLNFKDAHNFARKSFLIMAIDFWNDGNTIIQISEMLQLNTCTIRNYLKRGTNEGWCHYDSKEQSILNGKKQGGQIRRSVIQFNLDGTFIREWSSINSASQELDIGSTGIILVCKGKRKKSGGFKWMYKENYEKLKQLESQEK